MAYLQLITLGGTIASRYDSEAGGATPSLTGEQLIEAAGDRLPFPVRVASMGQVPGPGVTFALIHATARRLADALAAADCLGAVVSQGTDTLEETAYALDMLLPPDKAVVVTGAMRAASAQGADGPANLRDALAVAASRAGAGLGVLVVMNGQVHAARQIRKRHTVNLAAFTSPDHGPLGYVSEGRVALAVQPPLPPDRNLLPQVSQLTARVPLVSAAIDAPPDLLAACQQTDVDGVVVACLGAGHLPPSWMPPLRRLAAQVPVVCASRTGAGPLLRGTYGFAGSEQDLQAAGCYLSDEPPAQSRVRLTVLLSATPRVPLADCFYCGGTARDGGLKG